MKGLKLRVRTPIIQQLASLFNDVKGLMNRSLLLSFYKPGNELDSDIRRAYSETQHKLLV